MAQIWTTEVQEFYDIDTFSRLIPGRFVSLNRGGDKIPKGIYTASLSSLYRMFKSENPQFPYKMSTFKKYRPGDVQQPTESDREQCGCPKHLNVRKVIRFWNVLMTHVLIRS